MFELDGFNQVEGPEARALADAGGELMDLRFVDDALAALLSSWSPEAEVGPETTEARALWVAAVVWYARSFSGGVRTAGVAAGLAENLSSPVRASHEYVLALRDKHMAHSVNSFEQVYAGVQLGPAPAYAPEGISPLGLMMVLPTRERAVSVQLLTRELMSLMERRLQELGTAVNAVVLAMSPADRASLPTVAITPPLTTTDPALKRTRKRQP